MDPRATRDQRKRKRPRHLRKKASPPKVITSMILLALLEASIGGAKRVTPTSTANVRHSMSTFVHNSPRLPQKRILVHSSHQKTETLFGIKSNKRWMTTTKTTTTTTTRTKKGPTSLSATRETTVDNSVSTGDDDVVPLQESEFSHIMVVDEFLRPSFAQSLRQTFENRCQDGSSSSSDEDGSIAAERFMWDPWYHNNGQFNLLRTPADLYFGGGEGETTDFDAIAEELLEFGQSQLGCNAMSPIWLSLYTEGHEQKWHTDAWQGPWAFVLSLSPQEQKFAGGDTMIMKPEVLQHWSGFDAQQSLEQDQMIDSLEPLYNRLLVFDPRFPHRVEQVRNVQNPLEGRLVLHGWFTEPAPFVEGGLESQGEAVTEVLDGILPNLLNDMLMEPSAGRLMGFLSCRVLVDATSGTVQSVTALSDTLLWDPLDLPSEQDPVEALQNVKASIAKGLEKAQFPSAEEDTILTVPFEFE